MSKEQPIEKQRELRRAFVESLYGTLEGVISPTPYMEIREGDRVDVNFLNGRGNLPSPNTTEITILDIDTGSLFFDNFNVLFEGATGTGKTYTSDAIFNAVYGPDGHRTIRLSSGPMGTSALEPFTRVEMENGVPKTRIDLEKCGAYGALFIDEINRGDSQEVFQVVDGRIHVNGDSADLGIAIPGTNRKKKLAVIGAMNPADAQHSAALELDIAGENRFLKFRFPNGATETGSGQLEKRVAEDLHARFWDAFRGRTGMKGGWKDLYPIVTDSDQFPLELDGQTREFIDVALGYVGVDPKETYDRNIDLIKQGGIDPKFAMPGTGDHNYIKVLEAQGALKHGFVRRDLAKINNLSRLLSFIRGVKNGTYESGVTLNDATAATGIVLESKSQTGTEPGRLMNLVNDARKAYADLHRQTNSPAGYGFRQAVWQAAVHAGQERDFEAYLNTIRQGIGMLNTQATGVAQATLKSRLVSDMVVLDHFSRTHQADVEAALSYKDEGAFKAFGELYEAKKKEAAVYEHRVGSIVR